MDVSHVINSSGNGSCVPVSSVFPASGTTSCGSGGFTSARFSIPITSLSSRPPFPISRSLFFATSSSMYPSSSSCTHGLLCPSVWHSLGSVTLKQQPDRSQATFSPSVEQVQQFRKINNSSFFLISQANNKLILYVCLNIYISVQVLFLTVIIWTLSRYAIVLLPFLSPLKRAYFILFIYWSPPC